jgi:hypothetical protein
MESYLIGKSLLEFIGVLRLKPTLFYHLFRPIKWNSNESDALFFPFIAVLVQPTG